MTMPKDKLCEGTCGQMIDRRCTTCRACYFAAHDKSKRNRRIVLDYVAHLMTIEDIAQKHGLSIPRVYDLLRGHHSRLDPGLKKQRMAAKREGMVFKGGRPPIWPDCPPRLKEQYDILRKHYGYRAAEARDLLLEEERRAARQAA